MYVLIDNYDSFTYNLYHYLEELGAALEVFRHDEISVDALINKAPEGIILSPGPCSPNEAGICLEVIDRMRGTTPILGVCLGHQAIGQAYGGRVVRAPAVMHGKTSAVHHDGTSVFKDLPSPYEATRYHSLIVERESLPADLRVSAWSEDGLIMGLAHDRDRVHGVQFHPESIASEHGHQLLQNFLTLAGDERQAA